jgi:hypothetical protein
MGVVLADPSCHFSLDFIVAERKKMVPFNIIATKQKGFQYLLSSEYKRDGMYPRQNFSSRNSRQMIFSENLQNGRETRKEDC